MTGLGLPIVPTNVELGKYKQFFRVTALYYVVLLHKKAKSKTQGVNCLLLDSAYANPHNPHARISYSTPEK